MILQLIDYGAEYPGNFIPSIVELCKKTKEQLQLETVIVLPLESKDKNWIEILKQNQISVYFLDMSSNERTKLFSVINIIKVQKLNPTIVHTHFARCELISLRLKKILNCKVIHHKHMGFPRDSIFYYIYDLYKVRYLTNRYIDFAIPVSRYVQDNLEKCGFNKKKINMIENGICIEKHQKNLDVKNYIRKKYNIKQSSNVILFFGYDINTKGTDILFNAIRYNKNMNNIFVFVGRKKMKNYLENQPDYMKFKKNIIIIDHTENISELYNMADIFISASRYEAFSYSIAEAMLYEIPVIISDIPGTLFYKNAGKGVYTFENENYIDLIQTIEKVNKEKISSDYENNRRFIVSNYNLTRWVQKIIALYADLIK